MSNSNKTKILFVLPQLGAGGSERVVLDITKELSPRLFESYVTYFTGGKLEPQFHQTCKKLLHIKKKPGLDLRAMHEIARIIKKYKIDVVNAHHYMPVFYSFWGAKIIGRKRLIYTEHSVPEVGAVIESFHNKIFYLMLSQIDRVIGVSTEIVEKLRNNYPVYNKRFITILNGVDLERFEHDKRRAVASQFGLGPNNFVVGTIANFRKVKNHTCLLRAFDKIRRDFPQACLMLVGSGEPGSRENTEDQIKKIIIEKGMQKNVILAGYRDDIPAMLSVFDVFCLTSFSEGLPVSLLEAMAAKVPVVGSRVSGIKEIVKHRETGLLFDSDDDEDLAGLLSELIHNKELLKDLGDNGYEYVFSNHKLSTWVEKCSDIYLGRQ